MRSVIMSLSVETPSCFTTFSAWVNSRLRTGVPAFSESSSSRNKLLGALDGLGAAPSSLIQPSRDVALTPSSLFERLQIAGVVVEKLLREAGVFEMKGFGRA